jgi:hypothetical protein
MEEVCMRVLVSTLGMAMVFTQSCLGQTAPKTASPSPQSSSPAFVIAVDGPTPPVRLESTINVNVTVTNVSGKEMWWEWERQHKDAGYRAFSWLLTKGGREVETTFFGRKISNRQREDDPQEVESGSLFPVTYSPGKMFTITIDLRRLYEIKEPGVYTLVVSRLDENNKTTVRSDPLTLKIGP